MKRLLQISLTVIIVLAATGAATSTVYTEFFPQQENANTGVFSVSSHSEARVITTVALECESYASFVVVPLESLLDVSVRHAVKDTTQIEVRYRLVTVLEKGLHIFYGETDIKCAVAADDTGSLNILPPPLLQGIFVVLTLTVCLAALVVILVRLVWIL